MKKIINSPKAPAPIGPYSQAVKVENTLYLSGQIAINPATGSMVNDSIENETKQIMENIGHVLEAAGMDFTNLFKCSIFLKDMDNFSSVNELNLRLHPQDRHRRELQYSNFIEFKNNKINKVNYKSRFDKLVKKHSLIIFTYLSTEFFKMMALNKPCLVLINKKNIDNLFNAVAKKDFEKLIDIGILHTNGLSLANKLNLISNNVENWWNNKEIIKAKDEFCKNYSNPHFNIDTFINELKILK